MSKDKDSPDEYDELLDELTEETKEPSITDYFEPQDIPTFEDVVASLGADDELPDLDDLAVAQDEYLGEVKDKVPEPLARQRPDVQADLLKYDNPEALFAGGPQTYRLRIVNPLLADSPTVVSAQIDKINLNDIFIECIVDSAWRQSQLEGKNESKEDIWTELMADESGFPLLNDMNAFFVRAFPHLLVKIFNIALTASATAIIRNLEEDADEREKGTRAILQLLLADIENFLKARMKTRSKGRPLEFSEGLAGNVWKVALEMMGSERGKSAVPALKSVADRLGLTTNCLSKRLKVLGRGWQEVIKPELESLPKSVLPFGYTK
jgi:hypothetical protein